LAFDHYNSDIIMDTYVGRINVRAVKDIELTVSPLPR